MVPLLGHAVLCIGSVVPVVEISIVFDYSVQVIDQLTCFRWCCLFIAYVLWWAALTENIWGEVEALHREADKVVDFFTERDIVTLESIEAENK